MAEAVESEEQSNSEQIQSSISNSQPKSINKAIVDKSYTKNEKKCNKRYYLDSIKRFILILLQIYNLAFIPIQGAYRVKFSPPLIILELITIVFYVVDFVLLCSKYKRIKQSLSKITNESSLNSNIILNPVEADRKQLKILKIHFILSAICWIPFAMIFSFTNIDEPTLLIYFIKCTRLLKTWPLRRLSNFWKRHYLKTTRIIEMLLIYYIVIHIFAWSLIWIAYNAPDIRTTWLKRLPVPQPTGVRLYADKTGLSDFSIYCHAFNFSVNTLSHVATGEVSMITYQERIYWAFIILFSTFMYAFLFGNITSIVSDFASQKVFFKFYKRYENVMNSVKAGSVPKRVISSIKDYFEFDWLNSHGIQIEDMSQKLPSWISTDILASRYLLSIQNWILFKDLNGKIDVPFVNSLLISLKFRTYMDGDFIVIGGSHSRNTYIIMEGEAGIFSFNDDFISFMITGSHYSNDLDSDDEDTFQYKRPIHIISKGTSIVGVLTLDMLNELYLAYPNFKEKMRTSNKQFNLFAKEHLKIYLNSLNIDYNMTSAINEITKHLSYSSSSVYDHLREKLDVIDLKSTELNDMSIEVKQTERLGKIEENRELNYFDERRDINWEHEIKVQVNEIKKSWFSRIQFSKYSNILRTFDILHIINMFYIIISIPLWVGFQIKMEFSLIAIEIISIFISLITIVINLRVQVIRRSGPTVDFKEVISYYYSNGLILDLFGLWPLNLVLGAPNLVQPFWIISVLRIIRCIWSVRIYSVIRKFEISLQKYGLIINILKAWIFVWTIWHLIAWIWSFVNIYLEPDEVTTWIEYQNLSNSPLYSKILYWYFNILNTVTTVGYTSLAPVTDIERLFIAFTINCGDALFAVGFGLLAGIITQSSIYGRSEAFFRKMNSIKDLLKERNCEESYIAKIEQYFAFLWYSQNKSTNIMVIKDLSEQLPYRLSTEVVYHWTKELLEPMFGKFGSENLIRDLSSVLKQTIYLPEDFIILKGDIGEEMYFIAEGSVLILAADKRTVISTLSKGAYFGEMAIFLDSNKRTAYVQAETFCNILILLKQSVDRIKNNYPSVADDIKREAMKRLNEAKTIVENKWNLIAEYSTSNKDR